MSDNYVDFSDIYKALSQLGKDVSRESNKIMNDIVPKVAEKFSERLPYWDGSKSSSGPSYKKAHMKDHVVYSKAKDGVVEIGFDSEVAWRIHFTEFGTIKQPPQHFVEKSLDDLSREVQTMVEIELQRRVLK